MTKSELISGFWTVALVITTTVVAYETIRVCKRVHSYIDSKTK